MRQFWDWHVRRFLGRRRWFQDRASQQVDRPVADEAGRFQDRLFQEERERVRSASPSEARHAGAYVSPPQPKGPPVSAKPIAKSQICSKATS
eukprot:2888475-Karenia_brevis.AAC.1